MPYSPQHILTCRDLYTQMGGRDAPCVIDVRIKEDQDALPQWVPSAHHLPHTNIASFDPGPRRCVIICHKGQKLSLGAAALLRAHGHSAQILQGGMVEWARLGLPTIKRRAHRWVIDDAPTATNAWAAWMLTRFMAPDAVIMAVPKDAMPAVAERFDAAMYAAPHSLGLDHPTLNAMMPHLSQSADVALVINAALADQDAVSALDRTTPIFDALFHALHQPHTSPEVRA